MSDLVFGLVLGAIAGAVIQAVFVVGGLYILNRISRRKPAKRDKWYRHE